MRSNLLLLITAIVWGFAFVAQRTGMEFIGPYAFNAARFALGSIALTPIIILNNKKNLYTVPASNYKASAFYFWGLAAGLVLFFGSSFQQIGIVYTTAGKAGFITGLYIVLVPIFGIFIKQSTSGGTWIGAIVAVIGLYLLSVTESLTIGYGDLLVLISSVFWAIHVLLIGKLSPKTDAIKLAAFQFAICSIISFVSAIIFEITSFQNLIDALLPIIYAGLVSVGIGYTLQVVAQQKAHPSHAAIIMSLESVFAVIGGWILLSESIPLRGIAGCGLMLAGMVISQLSLSKKIFIRKKLMRDKQ